MYREILDPIVQLFSSIILSGAATTVATQIMKSDMIPLPLQNYPRVTAAVVAFISSLVAIYSTNLELVVNSTPQFIAYVLGVLLVATMSYNHIIKERENSTTRF